MFVFQQHMFPLLTKQYECNQNSNTKFNDTFSSYDEVYYVILLKGVIKSRFSEYHWM